MAKFLTGEDLSKKVYDIIWEAEEMLLIVSPFIKLDDYFKTIFEKHKYNHKLHITIVFGKNESQPSKSLRREDFEFFKQFKNISIIYCSPLHAKYYANDGEGVLTSINLYDHSFKNNIEYGVYFPGKLANLFMDSAEEKALQFTMDMIEKHPAVFIKRPVYEKKFLGKNYIESSIIYDATDKILNLHKWNTEPKKFIQEFPIEINANEFQERPERPETAARPEREIPKTAIKPNFHKKYEIIQENGFCIRSGKPIPFDLKRPMNLDSFQSWNQFKNQDFPEKYCHKTGKLSNGKTSMRKPILN